MFMPQPALYRDEYIGQSAYGLITHESGIDRFHVGQARPSHKMA